MESLQTNGQTGRQTNRQRTTGDQKISFQPSVQVSLKMKYLIISDSWKSWCLLRGQILYVMWCPMTQGSSIYIVSGGDLKFFKDIWPLSVKGHQDKPILSLLSYHLMTLDTKIKNILWFRGGDPNFFQRYLSTSCFKGVLITIF